MSEKFVYEFTQVITLKVPDAHSHAMNTAINMHHTGKAALGRDEVAHPVHLDAAYASHMGYQIEVRVGVTAHGKLHLIGQTDTQFLREIVRQTVQRHHDPNAIVSDEVADITIARARAADVVKKRERV